MSARMDGKTLHLLLALVTGRVWRGEQIAINGITDRDMWDHGSGMAWVAEYVRLSVGDDQVVEWCEVAQRRGRECR